MIRKVDRNVAVTLTVACVHCGRSIVLAAWDDAVEIPDRDEFIRVHGGCLMEQPADSADASR